MISHVTCQGQWLRVFFCGQLDFQPSKLTQEKVKMLSKKLEEVPLGFGQRAAGLPKELSATPIAGEATASLLRERECSSPSQATLGRMSGDCGESIAPASSAKVVLVGGFQGFMTSFRCVGTS